MNDKEIATTLNRLNDIIELKKHELGIEHEQIRVRIGRELMAWIRGYIDNFISCTYKTQQTTIFGYPIEIEYENPMCLEVHIVESVPIYKECEADD